MGVDGLNSITYYGSGANYNLGQNNNANYPWPRVNVNDYRRTIDFTKPALVSTGQTYAVPVTGGVAQLAPFTQNIQSTNPAWAWSTRGSSSSATPQGSSSRSTGPRGRASWSGSATTGCCWATPS